LLLLQLLPPLSPPPLLLLLPPMLLLLVLLPPLHLLCSQCFLHYYCCVWPGPHIGRNTCGAHLNRSTSPSVST
jgi:hypothetical protein